jgi:hypothetical protein
MTTAECLPMWVRIFDRMTRSLPIESETHLEIAVLRERIVDALAGDFSSIEDIESRLRDFALHNAGLLSAATDETVGELFALVDPIRVDLWRADAEGTLNSGDQAAAKGYVAMLEACGTVTA